MTLAAMMAAEPTAPTPKTTRDVPAAGCSSLSTAPAPVCRPQPSGPSFSSGTSAGTLTTLRSTTLAYVAKEDWPKKWEDTCSPFEDREVVPSGRRPPKHCA